MLIFKYNGFGGYTYVGICIYILLEMPIRVLLNRCYGLCPLCKTTTQKLGREYVSPVLPPTDRLLFKLRSWNLLMKV